LNEVVQPQAVVTVALRVEIQVDLDLWTDSRLIAMELERRLLTGNDEHAPEAVQVLRVETDLSEFSTFSGVGDSLVSYLGPALG